MTDRYRCNLSRASAGSGEARNFCEISGIFIRNFIHLYRVYTKRQRVSSMPELYPKHWDLSSQEFDPRAPMNASEASAIRAKARIYSIPAKNKVAVWRKLTVSAKTDPSGNSGAKVYLIDRFLTLFFRKIRTLSEFFWKKRQKPVYEVNFRRSPVKFTQFRTSEPIGRKA